MRLILDLSGTMVMGGEIVQGVAEPVAALKAVGMACCLLTADTRGRRQEAADALDLLLNAQRPITSLRC